MFREGFIRRPRLIGRLLGSTGPRVAVIAAPAGYGKTTLLSEWEMHDPRPFTWASGRIEQAMVGIDQDEPFVLVLDDAHQLAPSSFEVLRQLVYEIPAGSLMVIASRTEPRLQLGRLRAHRALLELGARDLAMSTSEAAGLLGAEGLGLSGRQVDALVHATEGWPAALYLASLSLHNGMDVARFGGDDAAVADYLREVVLAGLDPNAVDFLVRTSVVDRLSGPVCDAVLDRQDSARTLEELGRSNLLLVPLDRAGRSYRCHALLSQMLQSELQRRDPYAEPELRRRAMEWYAAHDDGGRAIDQAIAAGATTRAGELLRDNVPELISNGRNDVVRSWLSSFTTGQIASDPHLTLVAATSQLIMGRLDAVQRWESVAARALGEPGLNGHRGALAAGVAVMRAASARDGAERMAQDAALGYSLEHEDSPARSTCCFMEGVALHLTGDLAGAERLLVEGARRGAVAAPHIQALCLTQLALMAVDRDDWESAADLCARARAQVAHFSVGDYPTSALVFAVSARVRAHLGRVADAGEDVRHARRLLAELGDFAPWYEAEARAALAHAALRLGNLPDARDLIAEASRYARRMPDARTLHEWLDDVNAHADTVSGVALPGPAALTPAELRILGFLPTHLSFREIAGRLYVSANTVKTQAHAVYRKLDASSRSQAVAHATRLGLLDL
jgi:LuxR family maltose regulon positive regulatory protein